MSKKSLQKRQQISITDKTIKYFVWAAMADFSAVSGRSLSEAIVWLTKQAINALYGKRLTIRRFLASILSSKKYFWSETRDPLDTLSKLAMFDPDELGRVMQGEEPSNELLAAIAGQLDEEDDTILFELARRDTENENGHVEIECEQPN